MIRVIRAILRRRLEVAPAYGHQIWFSLKQQVVIAILASLVMDRGQAARGTAAVLIGYWIGTVIILVRRPLSPSKGDLLFVRWGFSLIAAAFMFTYIAVGLFLPGAMPTLVVGMFLGAEWSRGF